jgi:hypothetical protein
VPESVGSDSRFENRSYGVYPRSWQSRFENRSYGNRNLLWERASARELAGSDSRFENRSYGNRNLL